MSEKNSILAACLLVLASGELATSIVEFTGESESKSNTEAARDISRVRAYAAVDVIVDTVLAVTLVILLHRRKAECIFSRTNSIINRIMLYTISTGLLTGILALVAFVLSYGMCLKFVSIRLS